MHAVLLAAVLSLATGSGFARSVYQGKKNHVIRDSINLHNVQLHFSMKMRQIVSKENTL